MVERRQGVREERRRVRAAFVALALVFTLILTAIGIFAAENRERANEGREAHDALCVIKANFQVRKQRTEEFLRNNPGPIIIGIPRADFERSLADTISTLEALENLKCVPPPKPTTTNEGMTP